MAEINISVGSLDYEFRNVPFKVANAIVTILHECENDDSGIISAEFER